MNTNQTSSPANTRWELTQLISYDFPFFAPSQPPYRNWNLNPERAVLLVHDMQNYFLRRYDSQSDPVKGLVTNIQNLLRCARDAGMQIAYTVQPGNMSNADRGIHKDFWGAGMQSNPHDNGIFEPVKPCESDWIFTKWRYSAFIRSNLRERMIAHQKNQLIVCGVFGHIGVLATLIEAYSNDIETFLPGDAIGDFTAEEHTIALRLASNLCSVVNSSHNICAQLSQGKNA